MSFVLIFALQCLFPIFDLDAGEFSGVSIVNTDVVAREFTVTATSGDGVSATPGRVSLDAGAQQAFLLPELLGRPAPSPGWIRIDSLVAGCTSYVTSGNAGTLTGADAARRLEQAPPSTETILPHISVNTGFTELNHLDTLIAIVNPAASTSDVTARLFGLDGALRGTAVIRVPARGSRILRVSEAFQTVLPANTFGGRTFSGYVRLTAIEPVAAWQRIDSPLSRSLSRGSFIEEIVPASLVVIPHFVDGPGYASFVNILNPGTTAVTLELTALDERGRRLGEVVRQTLAPGESLRNSVSALFRIPVIAIFPPPTITGYIRIRESQGLPLQIAGDIEIVSQVQGSIAASMLFPLSDSPSTIWRLPFAVSSRGYFTGYAIANPNELLAVQTDVQVEIVGPDGAVVNTTAIQLSPLEKRAALIPAGVANGYMRIRSNFPVHVMGSIGTNDVSQLDQLPAIHP